MAVDIARLGIEIDSSQVRSANRDLDAMERRGKTVQDRFSSMGRAGQQLGRQLTTWLTLPLAGAGAMAIKTAADYETLKTQLEVLLGSASKAERVFGQLAEFAATTPFELDGIVKANNLLLGFGVGVERTQELLQTLGDIAAVTGGDLFSMARITGEARAEGKLLTRDLRQLISNGVPIIKLLSESLGVAESDIFDLATAGKIGFGELTDAFEMATAEGGLFFDGMAQRSNTLSGIFSNMKDSINLSLGSIGQTLIDTLDIKGVARELIANIEAATKWFNELDDSSQRMIITFGGVLMAIGPVIGILATLSVAIGAISAPVAAVVTAIALGTAAIIDHWEDVERYFTTGSGARMWETLQEIVGKSVRILGDLWDTFGDRIIQTTTTAFTIVSELFRTALNSISVMLDVFSGRWITDWSGFMEDTQAAAEDTFGVDGSVRIIFESLLLWLMDDWLVRLSYNMATGLGNLVIDALNALNLTEDDIDNIADFDTLIANAIERSISEGRAARSLRRARQRLAEELKMMGNEDIVMEDISALLEIDPNVRQIPFEDKGFTVPVDVDTAPVMGTMDELARYLNSIDMNLPDRILPPGSVGKLQEEIYALQEDIRHSLDPEEISEYQRQIEELEQQIRELTGQTKDQVDATEMLARAGAEMEHSFGAAMDRLILQGKSASDVFVALLDDINRAIIRAAIVKPLVGGITGGIGDLFGGLFAEGAAFQNGEVVTGPTTFPMSGGRRGMMGEDGPEAIMPLSRTSSGDLGVKVQGGAPVNIQVNNYSSEEVEVKEQRSAGGGIDIELVIGRVVKGMHNRGTMDSTMARNYGLHRRGRM